MRRRPGQAIGQLLFDPAGEYANVNVQDRTALSEIGPDYVTIFRYGSDGSDPAIRPLSTDFFRDDNIDVTWSIVSSHLRPRKDAIYIDDFLAADIIGPESEQDDQSAYRRARRRRAAFYATLLRADYAAPSGFACSFVVNARVLTMVNAKLDAGEQPFVTKPRSPSPERGRTRSVLAGVLRGLARPRPVAAGRQDRVGAMVGCGPPSGPYCLLRPARGRIPHSDAGSRLPFGVTVDPTMPRKC